MEGPLRVLLRIIHPQELPPLLKPTDTSPLQALLLQQGLGGVYLLLIPWTGAQLPLQYIHKFFLSISEVRGFPGEVQALTLNRFLLGKKGKPRLLSTITHFIPPIDLRWRGVKKLDPSLPRPE